MKSLHKISFLAVAITLVLSACTIEKRVSMPGYHVEWRKNRNTVHNQETAAKNEDKKIKSSENTAFAPIENETEISEEANLNMAATENTAKIALDEKADAPANNMVVSKKQAATASNNDQKVSVKQIVQAKKAVNKVKHEMKKKNNSSGDVDIVLLYVLCFLLPPIAVGLATDWDTNKLILNIILTILCGIPGIIHAIIVVSKSR